MAFSFSVGRTPWSARVPLDPLPGDHQADEGVGRGPGGPPHHRSGRKALAVGLPVVFWVAFAAMALHTSRFPVLLGRYSKEYAALLGIVFAAALAASVLQLPRVYQAFYGNRYVLVWLFVICPLLILIAVEGAMRSFNLLGSNFYSEIRRYTSVLVLDHDLYFKNPAGYRATYGRVEIATNEMGLRDHTLSPAPPPGTSRILVLGDSVAFGWGVNLESAFPRQLEEQMSLTGRPVETVNSSVPGYNSRQEMTFLDLFGARLRPDTVLLLYVDNDIDAIDPRRVHMGILPNPLKDPGGAFDYFLSMSRVCFMLRQMTPVLLGRVTNSPEQERATPGWSDSMLSVSRMARYCRERNVHFVTFHFRMMADPVSDALDSDLASLAQTERFDYADTLPWFRTHNIRQLTNSFIDTHPNAAGHRILAQGMTHFFLEHPALLGAPSR